MLSGLRWTFLCDVLWLGKCNEKVWSGDMSSNLALWDKATQRKQGSTQVVGWTISWPWPQLNLAPSGQKSTHFAKLLALYMPTVPLKTNEGGSLINHPGQLPGRHMASVHCWPIIWPILKLMRCTVRLGMPLFINLAVFLTLFERGGRWSQTHVKNALLEPKIVYQMFKVRGGGQRLSEQC